MSDAPKRASNPKRAERRKRCYLRAQNRNKRNEALNQERHKANLAALAELGGKIKTKEITKTTVKDGKLVTTTIVKNESASEALRRTRREAGAPTWAQQKAARAA